MFLNGDAYAVKIDPSATRFEFGASDYQRGYVKWVGAPTTPLPVPVLSSFVKALQAAGVSASFGPGTTIAEVAEYLRANARPRD